MKRNQKVLVTAVLSAVSALTLNSAFAALTPASIKDSPHNLGTGNVQATGKTPSGNPIANHSSNTAEICVFCHTPHGGDNGAAVPIWNRKLGINGVSGNLAYTRYSSLGTTTFDAMEAPIGSVSIACLSCHDGTQAIDNVINLPGSGGYNFATGAQIGGFAGGDATGGSKAGALGPGTTIVQNLTTDLSNDHPVSMQFGGGGVSVTTISPAKTFDPDFRVPQNMAAPTASGLQKLWYIESGSNSLNPSGRDRMDVILYTRNDVVGGGGVLQPTVECGSCHDPHNVQNPTFLRISNSGKTTIANNSDNIYPNANGGPSGLCLTCHDK